MEKDFYVQNYCISSFPFRPFNSCLMYQKLKIAQQKSSNKNQKKRTSELISLLRGNKKICNPTMLIMHHAHIKTILTLSLLLFTHSLIISSLTLTTMRSDYAALKRPFLDSTLQQSSNRQANQVRAWLVGAYTNEKQAVEDAKKGKPTAATGGHELVSAEITPYEAIPGSLLAIYRFGFQREQQPPFRFRLYQFYNDPYNNYDCIMTLLRPSATLEVLLKSNQYNLNAIPATVQKDNAFVELIGCEVGWKKKHLFNFVPFWKAKYEGVLICGSCQLQSSRDPTMMITAKDDLKLWKRELWVNDRVYSPTGELLIGNTEGIPYKFQKEENKHNY